MWKPFISWSNCVIYYIFFQMTIKINCYNSHLLFAKYDSIEWIYISCHNYNFPFFHTTSRAEMYCSQSCLVITDICVQDLNVAAIGYLWVKALWFLLFSGVKCCLSPMATMKYMSLAPCAVFVSQCTPTFLNHLLHILLLRFTFVYKYKWLTTLY